MPDKSPEEKDGLLELIKKLWLPIAGFLGAITLAYNFYQLWLGDQTTITYFTACGGLIVLVIVLGWVRLSKKTVVNKKKTKHEPRYSAIYRRIALGLLGIVVVGSGIGGWLLYKNSVSQAEALEKKIIILVAQFDGPEETYGLRAQIMEELHNAAKENSDVVIVDSQEIVTSGQGSNYARGLGEKENADLVIWAWYKPTDNPNITIHVENLAYGHLPIKSSETLQPTADLSELKSFSFQQQAGQEARALIFFLTGFIDFRTNNYESAITRFDSALANLSAQPHLINNPADIYFYRGFANLYLNQHQRAIQDFDKAIQLDPNLDAVYNNRGIAYTVLRDYEHAIQDFDKAIQLDPNDVSGYINRGIAYSDLHDYDRAIQDFDKAIELDPNDAIAYVNRGYTYSDLQDYSRAILDFDKAIQLEPNSVAIYNNRGYAYRKMQDYNRAIRDFDKAIELNPNFAATYINRGGAYSDLQDYDRAIQDFNRAIELNPNSVQLAAAYLNRGVAYYYLKDYDRAIQDYSRGIELDPSIAEAYRNRGFAYQKLSKTAEAEADFAKYKELTGQDVP
ncbi:MAG: tetratricopeptide repeat protein [Anaerolineales bacterium]|nr:tetratricopeptide repeat protein [Anaerolineales bacterium]